MFSLVTDAHRALSDPGERARILADLESTQPFRKTTGAADDFLAPISRSYRRQSDR
jgi:hypothetical protein